MKSAFPWGKGGGAEIYPSLTLASLPCRLGVKSLWTTGIGLQMENLGPRTPKAVSRLLAYLDATVELGPSKWQLWSSSEKVWQIFNTVAKYGAAFLQSWKSKVRGPSWPRASTLRVKSDRGHPGYARQEWAQLQGPGTRCGRSKTRQITSPGGLSFFF